MTNHPYPLKELIDAHNEDIQRKVKKKRLQKQTKKEQQKTSLPKSKAIGKEK